MTSDQRLFQFHDRIVSVGKQDEHGPAALEAARIEFLLGGKQPHAGGKRGAHVCARLRLILLVEIIKIDQGDFGGRSSNTTARRYPN